MDRRAEYWVSTHGQPSSRVQCLKFYPRSQSLQGESMTKALDQIDDAIRNAKHPFRQVADRPEKPQKHRYERRKIREYMRSGDWTTLK